MENPEEDTPETVQIETHIKIDDSGVHDTGLTVAQWNALTDEQRGAIYQQAWAAVAERDNGGVTVLTPGAKDD